MDTTETMIYALRCDGAFRTLVELKNQKHLRPGMERVSRAEARRWVAADRIHETGLYLDEDGKVRYDHPQS